MMCDDIHVIYYTVYIYTIHNTLHQPNKLVGENEKQYNYYQGYN
jgi:hypothetical protein